MANQLSGIAGVSTGITALSNLIVVSPAQDVGYYAQNGVVVPGLTKPKDRQRGLLFHYEGENTATLEAEITDHYVENNSAINDQIALKPEVITVQGFIGEVNDVAPLLDEYVQLAKSKLIALNAYAPELSTSALIAINEAILAYEVISNAFQAAQQTVARISGGEYKNKQQEYFANFYNWFNKRTLFTIQTPWNVFENMAIKSLRAVQTAETRMITDFEITFKKINYVSSNNLTSQEQNRALNQYSTETNLGSNNLNQKSNVQLSDIYTEIGVTS